MQWIPRTSNQQADVSRLIDTDDWQITEENFLFLDGRWKPIVLIVLPIIIITSLEPQYFGSGGVGHGPKGIIGKKSKTAHLHLTFALFTSLVTP